MDYSLQNLNKIGKLDSLTFQTFVEKLNLIGLEVDEILEEKIPTNLFLQNLQIVLKIPANREDLLTENFFLQEISTIFLFELLQTWKKVKNNYFPVLKQKYSQYLLYSHIKIPTTKKKIITYAIQIEEVNIKSSPVWLSKKLATLGFKSINNVTDIINLGFSEWGQSFNCISLLNTPKSTDHQLKIECLKETESYNSIFLSPGTIVLKNEQDNSILSVLGILNSTFFTNQTKLEKASFLLEGTFYDIHTNPLLLNTLNSKISLKYLRRASFENFRFSFQRILTLLELLTTAKIFPTVYSVFDDTVNLENTKILSLKKINLFNFLKVQFPDLLIFKKASLELICETKNEYYFKIPNSRQDLMREIDLIEEYSRFVGYKNFQEILPKKAVNYTKTLFREKNFIKNFFLQHGFNEIITNPLTDIENKNNFSVLLTNPLNNELAVLRRSLIPKLLHVFELNSRSSYVRTNFFEVGRTFKYVNHKIVEQDKLGGVFQVSTLKAAKKTVSEWFVAKGLIENILSLFGYTNIEIEKKELKTSYFHPKRSILFSYQTRILGIFGEIHPLIAKAKYSHVRGTIYLFELNLNYFKQWQLSKNVNVFSEYSRYPLIVKDLSITLETTSDFNLLKSIILKYSTYLKKVTLFDIYFEENIIDKVNIGIRLEFQSNIETLTNEVIELEIEKIKAIITQQFTSSYFQ